MGEWAQRLYQELDQWNFAGEEVTFWWRDDDARERTSQLQQLLALSERWQVPVALAAIPLGCREDLPAAVERSEFASVLQHGYGHVNHAAEGEKKAELGRHRDLDAVVAELEAGRAMLESCFASRFLPVLVPPWNRIDESVIERLAAAGFAGVSTYTPRQQREPCSGLWAVNTHVDVMDWKQRRFLGENEVVERFVRHLRDRRHGECDSSEPTGLLTHHLVHDESCWRFLGELLALMDDHPAVRWIDAEQAFAIRWR